MYALPTPLQQYLPFTVLKLQSQTSVETFFFVATVLTVYGIETGKADDAGFKALDSCNSTYRLRY